MSASSELTSVNVRRDAWAHTSSARDSTLRVPYGSSCDGRRAEDKLGTKYNVRTRKQNGLFMNNIFFLIFCGFNRLKSLL